MRGSKLDSRTPDRWSKGSPEQDAPPVKIVEVEPGHQMVTFSRAKWLETKAVWHRAQEEKDQERATE